jgi:23S rRNA (guanine2535-N1)-methyltransferase
MQYRFGLNQNYEDFASGRVLHNAKGVPNFPVRLINEIYGRCLSYSVKKDNICLFDCCCGGGYSLTVLGFLNQRTMKDIIASDIDPDMLKTAKSNLTLLSVDGLQKREEELQDLYDQFQKESHKESIQSAERLKKLLVKDMQVQVVCQDAFCLKPLDQTPDIIITDVPYGDLVQWQGSDHSVNALVLSLKNISSPHTIIAISMNKNQKITCMDIKRLERQVIGKRKFEIFQFI